MTAFPKTGDKKTWLSVLALAITLVIHAFAQYGQMREFQGTIKAEIESLRVSDQNLSDQIKEIREFILHERR